MADLDLAAIRTELAAVLELDVDVAGVGTVYDHLEASPSLPAIHVCGPTAVTYHATYGEACDVTIKLTLEVARENLTAAQRQLDRWLSRPGPMVRLEQHDADAWSELAVRTATSGEPRSLGDPAAGEIASLAVDVLIDINT